MPADESMKMDDRDAKVKKILERFGDVQLSEQASVQQLKKILDDFLENGPGTRQERERVLLDRLLQIDPLFKDFQKRN